MKTYLQAISDGLREEMRRDERVFVIGEDVGVYGGAFKVTQGFQAEFGEWRVLDAPLLTPRPDPAAEDLRPQVRGDPLAGDLRRVLLLRGQRGSSAVNRPGSWSNALPCG